MPVPSMASAARNGIAGLRAYLPSSIKGGARSAEEVTVHTTMLSQQRRRAQPRDRRHDQEGRAGQRGGRDHPDAEAAEHARDFVGGNAGGEIADGEDGLVEHQHQDDGLGRNPGRCRQLGQINDIDRPAQREEELQHRQIPAEPVEAVLMAFSHRDDTLPMLPRSTASWAAAMSASGKVGCATRLMSAALRERAVDGRDRALALLASSS